MGSISGAPEGGEPETTGRPGAKATVPGEKAGAARRPARILILEDDAWDAELAQRLLTGAGLDFTAVVVDTRTAFAEQLAAFRPDIILSDFHLPGFTGEVALEIAQQQCPHIPFIIWSGVLGDEAAVGLIKQGATDYVLKDRPARLASAIQLALAEEAVNLTRQRLAAARRQATAADPPP